MLDDGDLSRFGSDEEDLEEDFVLQANLPEEAEEEEEEIGVVENFSKLKSADCSAQMQEVDLICGSEAKSHGPEKGNGFGGEKPRVRRLLDEQFDMVVSHLFSFSVVYAKKNKNKKEKLMEAIQKFDFSARLFSVNFVSEDIFAIHWHMLGYLSMHCSFLSKFGCLFYSQSFL